MRYQIEVRVKGSDKPWERILAHRPYADKDRAQQRCDYYATWLGSINEYRLTEVD